MSKDYNLREKPKPSRKARESMGIYSDEESDNDSEMDNMTIITQESSQPNHDQDINGSSSSAPSINKDSNQNRPVDNLEESTTTQNSQLNTVKARPNTDMETILKCITEQNQKLSEQIQNKIQEQVGSLQEQIHEQNRMLGNQIEELKVSHKLSNQKIDNLDQKIDNLQINLEQQILVKEEQILKTMKFQIEDLDTKIQLDRKSDICKFNEQIEHLEKLTKQESIMRSQVEEQNKSKFQEHEDMLEKHKHRIHVVEDQIGEIRHINKNYSGFPSNITVTCTGMNSNQDNLKFSGKIINPQEYLSKMKRAYDKNRSRFGDDPSNDRECLHEILDVCMEGSANQWWQLNKTNIDNWQQFEDKFIDKYWNQDIQRHLKQKIELERYRPGGRLNRVDYFLQRVLILKSMTPPMNEDQIVNVLSPHYDQIVQTAQRVQNLNNIKSFESLLQREDMLDTQRHFQSRTRIRPDSSKTFENRQDINSTPLYNQNNFKAYISPRQNSGRMDQQYREDRRPTYNNYNHNTNNHVSNNPHNQWTNMNNQHGQGNQNRYQDNNRSKWNRKPQYPTQEQIETCQVIVGEGKNKPKGPQDGEVYSERASPW